MYMYYIRRELRANSPSPLKNFHLASVANGLRMFLIGGKDASNVIDDRILEYKFMEVIII